MNLIMRLLEGFVMDIKQEVEVVKKELVEIIIESLKANKISVDEAKKLANDFLNVLPVSSYNDLLNKLKSLGEEHSEVKKIYVDELEKASKARDKEALNKMRDLIKLGKIEEAVSVANSMEKEGN